MRWHDLYVSSVGQWLPPRIDMTTAVAEGMCSQQTHERTGLTSICVSDEAPVELAVRAADSALQRSAHASDDIAILLYATASYQGLDAWNAAAYVQALTGTARAFAVEVRQLSNGGMAAMELGAGFLSADPRRRAALLVTADRFAMPGFDRWNADRNMVWGDAGTAVVLSRDGGFARVLAMVSASDPELEGMYRGDSPLRPAPTAEDMPVNIVRRQREFRRRMTSEEVRRRLVAGFDVTLATALAEADASLDSISWAVVENLGRNLMDWRFLNPLKMDISRTTWPWGATIGHLGAGDQFAGLHHLATSGDVGPGDRVLLLGSGGGYAWTCAVVEITARPQWTTQ